MVPSEPKHVAYNFYPFNTKIKSSRAKLLDEIFYWGF
jgi:hypothetical protein